MMSKVMKWLMIGLVLVGLSACGGGGGSSGGGGSAGGGSAGGDSAGGGTGGNQNTSSDTTAPVITIVGDTNVTIEICSSLNLPRVTATDDRDGTVNVIKLRGFTTFDTCILGEHVFVYKAEDSAGNKAYAHFTVNVVGIKIALKDGNETSVYQYSGRYKDPGYVTESSYSTTVKVTKSGYVDTDVLGDYVLTYTATDTEGHSNTVTRTVSVISNPSVNVQHASTVTQFRKALENASVNGMDDVIYLSKGTYMTTFDGQGTFDFNDNEVKELRIYGEDSSVVIDGDNKDRVFDFDNSAEDGRVVLKNLTIRNGVDRGITSEVPLRLRNCDVHNNLGGGIYAQRGIATYDSEIHDNIRVGDSDYSGGGIYSDAWTKIVRSKIYNNVTESHGGGIYSKYTLVMYDSDVYGNVLRPNYNSSGAGIYIYKNSDNSSSSLIINSRIYNNISTHGDGGGLYTYYGDVYMYESQIYSNVAGDSIGGIRAEKLVLRKCEIKDNNASTIGSMYVGSYVNMFDSNITGNFVSNGNSGAGVYIDGFNGLFGDHYSSIIISSNISNNIVTNNKNGNNIFGVGVYSSMDPTRLYIANSIFANNVAVHQNGGNNFGLAIYMDEYRSLELFNNTIVNNYSVGDDNTYGTIYGKGKFYNNIIDNNTGTINFRGDSDLYNNYIDYSTIINENSYTIIKKENIVPKVGDVAYNSDYTLPAGSLLIDAGATPSSSWWGDAYYDDMDRYNNLLDWLKNDIAGKKRDVPDIGAYEYSD